MNIDEDEEDKVEEEKFDKEELEEFQKESDCNAEKDRRSRLKIQMLNKDKAHLAKSSELYSGHIVYYQLNQELTQWFLRHHQSKNCIGTTSRI
ncbi:hypothetical protein HYD98_03890 [Mycoplasmopsis bovis]|nr:hypothetical protein [Mycoplasmopsis bovis]QQH29385.1 hypothetical protein HYD98_03890 [Mycoplasmopsis bovis]